MYKWNQKSIKFMLQIKDSDFLDEQRQIKIPSQLCKLFFVKSFRNNYIWSLQSGEVQEWLNWLPWKGSVSARVPWVRIPPSPPFFIFYNKVSFIADDYCTKRFYFLCFYFTNFSVTKIIHHFVKRLISSTKGWFIAFHFITY